MSDPNFTTARIAKIAASIDLEPEAAAQILAANALDEEAWERIEDEEDAMIRAELESQDLSRLNAYDAAYLTRIEEERGPLSDEAFASIVDASSRAGAAEARLRVLEIPEAAFMVLLRVFERRRMAAGL